MARNRSNIGRLRVGSIGWASAWLPSRRSTGTHSGACSRVLSGQARSLVGYVDPLVRRAVAVERHLAAALGIPVRGVRRDVARGRAQSGKRRCSWGRLLPGRGESTGSASQPHSGGPVGQAPPWRLRRSSTLRAGHVSDGSRPSWPGTAVIAGRGEPVAASLGPRSATVGSVVSVVAIARSTPPVQRVGARGDHERRVGGQVADALDVRALADLDQATIGAAER